MALGSHEPATEDAQLLVARREAQMLQRADRGHEVAVRVLGVEADLDRMPGDLQLVLTRPGNMRLPGIPAQESVAA